MKPEKINKLPANRFRRTIYAVIIILCIIAIGIALYNQYYKDEKLEVIFGISNNDDDKEEKNSELKANFNSIFDNKYIDKLNINYHKIEQDKDVIYSQYSNNVQDKNYSLNVELPYVNINNSIIKKYNNEIKTVFQTKAEEILQNNSNINTVYTVSYKAYIIDNIISLIIRLELKEGGNSQRVIIQTYNFDVEKEKEVTINDFLSLKNITNIEAEKEINNEIEQKNKQNKQLEELGYNMYVRDTTSNIYDIKNTTEFFMDENENLYIVYAYGNSDFTSEMDLVIF